MRWSIQITSLLAAGILACALPAHAGPLAPCLKAVASKNGNFLVITDTLVEPELDNRARVLQVSLHVFPREKFVNEKDRVTSSQSYWEDTVQWSVVLDSTNSQPVPGCPLSLITDDGEFLILLNVQPTAALRIYRRRDHLGDPLREGPDHGVFIKDVTLREIWPADKLAGAQIMTDESPQWFAGGTFDFSADCRSLIHKTRWGDTVRINLQDGFVSRTSPFQTSPF